MNDVYAFLKKIGVDVISGSEERRDRLHTQEDELLEAKARLACHIEVEGSLHMVLESVHGLQKAPLVHTAGGCLDVVYRSFMDNVRAALQEESVVVPDGRLSHGLGVVDNLLEQRIAHELITHHHQRVTLYRR